ncbi:MAG: hypothetical protein R6W92_14855 [Desulfocurvibacter africanus]
MSGIPRVIRDKAEMDRDTRVEVEQGRYLQDIENMKLALMRLSQHERTSRSDKLMLRRMISTAGLLGQDLPLTSTGRRALQRVFSAEHMAEAGHLGRGCRDD